MSPRLITYRPEDQELLVRIQTKKAGSNFMKIIERYRRILERLTTIEEVKEEEERIRKRTVMRLEQNRGRTKEIQALWNLIVSLGSQRISQIGVETRAKIENTLSPEDPEFPEK